jgi:hypothetical protein
MPAHQCPRCPLLFTFRTELEWHLANDHRDRGTTNPRPDESPTPQSNRIPSHDGRNNGGNCDERQCAS